MAPILSAWRRRIQRYQRRSLDEGLPENLQTALYYRNQYGWSQRRAAKEAHVDVAALSAVEQQMGVRRVERLVEGEYIKTTLVRGHVVIMLTYTKEYGMVGVDLDSRTASMNGAYLNYVRATVYETGGKGEQLTAREYPDASHIADFTNYLHAHGTRNFEFHAAGVYKVVKDGTGSLTFDDEPFRENITLHWVVNTRALQYLEAVRAGDKMDPYPRR